MKWLHVRQKWVFGFILTIFMCSGSGVPLVSAGTELTPVGDSFVIATPSASEGQVFPDIRSSRLLYHDVAVAGDGTLVATWVFGKTEDLDASGYDVEYPFPVYARRFNANGAPLSEVIEVTADAPETSTSNVAATVASDAAGNFVVCWTQYANDGANSQYVYARLFNADGTPRGDSFQVSDAIYRSRSDYDQAAVDMNTDGRFIVAWRGDGIGDRSDLHRPVLAKRFSDDGTVLDDTPIQVNSTSENLNTYCTPSVDVNDKGQFVIGWSDQRILTNWWWQVRWLTQKFDADGKPRGSTKVVYRRYGTMNVDIPPDRKIIGWNTTPAVAMNNSGELSVSWIPNWYNYDIGPYYRFYRPSGIARGSAASLPEARISSKRVANVLNEDGSLIMAWQGNSLDCEGDAVYVARTTSNAFDSPVIIQAGGCSGPMNLVSDPAMDANADGEIAVIWHDGQQLFGRVYQ